MEFDTNTLLIKLIPGDNCHGWSGHLSSLGWPPSSQEWSPTRMKCTKDREFGQYTLLTKLTPGGNCHRWSHTITRIAPTHPRMVTHKPKDGYPPEGSVLKTANLILGLNSQN